MTSFYLHLFKDSASKYSHVLRHTRVGHQHRTMDGGTTQPSRCGHSHVYSTLRAMWPWRARSVLSGPSHDPCRIMSPVPARARVAGLLKQRLGSAILISSNVAKESYV